jgi:hypothetical protein
MRSIACSTACPNALEESPGMTFSGLSSKEKWDEAQSFSASVFP